jgi:hypothetical protein
MLYVCNVSKQRVNVFKAIRVLVNFHFIKIKNVTVINNRFCLFAE